MITDIKNQHKHWKKEVMLITKMIKNKKPIQKHTSYRVGWQSFLWVFSAVRASLTAHYKGDCHVCGQRWCRKEVSFGEKTKV